MHAARAAAKQLNKLLFRHLLSNLLSARSLFSPKGASKMLRATGHARMAMVKAPLVAARGAREGSG